MKGNPRHHELRTRRTAVRALKRLVGGVDRNARRKYIRDFQKEVTTYQEIASYDDLIVGGYRADVIYVGDYHALPACQQFCARFLADMARRWAHVVLAMEMIYGRQQRLLDDWLAERVDEEEFLHRLRYEEEWGYEWSGFRAILETARAARLPVIGIDRDPRSGFRSIRRRDAYAARRIAEVFVRDPRAKVVAFVGESHLARGHLPARVTTELLRRQLEKRALIIVQNPDEIHWKLAEAGLDHVEVVRIEADRFAVFNASPLAKYEAYRQTLERWRGQSSDDEIDLAPTMYSMIDAILRFLRLDRDRTMIGRRHGLPVRLADVYPEIYTREGPPFLRRMLRRHGLEAEHVEQVLTHLEKSGSCYVPRVNAIFLGTFELTHAGEEASHFVNAALKGELYERWSGNALPDHDRFYSTVMEEAIGYFGSKLIDPSRNHFFETDFYRYYRKDRKVVEERTGYRYEDFTAIIEFILLHKRFEKTYSQHDRVPPALMEGIRSQGDRFRILTHELGYFLGQQIHDGYRRGLVSQRDLVGLYGQSFAGTSSALRAYLDWTERLAPLAER